ARRPVSKRTVRVPKEPLSITASDVWTPSTGDLLDGIGLPRPVVCRAPRSVQRRSSIEAPGCRRYGTCRIPTGGHYRGPALSRRGSAGAALVRTRDSSVGSSPPVGLPHPHRLFSCQPAGRFVRARRALRRHSLLRATRKERRGFHRSFSVTSAARAAR